MLGKALQIAATAFKDKKDKGGKPYFLHCLYVMYEVQNLGEHAMIIAVLHDLLEDCEDWSIERLITEGFDVQTVHALTFLTHDRKDTYEDYIEKLSHHKLCREIKKADLKHNSQIYRLKGLTDKDFERMQKYCKAYEFLK